MAADVQSPRGGRVTTGFRQPQPGRLGSFKNCQTRAQCQGWDGRCCQETGQLGSQPTTPSRRAHGSLEGPRATPWTMGNLRPERGTCTLGASPPQCRPLQKEAGIQL